MLAAFRFTGRRPILNSFESIRMLSSDINVIATTVPTVYTEARFNHVVELQKNRHEARYLFGCTPKYISPQDFKHNLPSNGLPEFAFVGRSNTGKSSLISALMGDAKKLVRVSKQAGCTRSVNFYAFCKMKYPGHNDHAAYLVDLPGYGFAQKSKREQVQWLDMIQGYFVTRDPTVLRRIFMLIDGRRGAQDSDLHMMHLLNQASLPYQVVLTKSDLLSETELAENLHRTFDGMSRLPRSTCFPFIHVVSSHTGSGIEQLRLAIGGIYGNKSRDLIDGVVVEDSKSSKSEQKKKQKGDGK